MYDIDACPCCGCRNCASYPALLAPFIADYVLKAKASLARLLVCPDCSFRFFSPRFDAAETQRLYGQYRGPDYVRVRHRNEFWYSKHLSDGIGVDGEEVAFRRASTLKFLSGLCDTSAVGSVLDYGGDRGQFIPPQLGKERSVYEISGLDMVEGVTLIRSKEALAGRSFDFIMLENVLEHSSDPAGLLKELRSYAHVKGSRFFFSVPYEPCSLAFLPKGAWAQNLYARYLKALLDMPPVCALVDLYSIAFRLKLGLLPPLGFLKLHEHINAFNERSLAALLKSSGFTVLGFGSYGVKRFASYGSCVLCLAETERA